MVDFYRRVWQAFLVAAPVFAGVAFISETNHFVFGTFLILTIVSFAIFLAGLYADFVYTRREQTACQAEKARQINRDCFPKLD